MAAFHRAGRERVNVFPVAGSFRFRHYLSEAAFTELRRYYRRYDYRFEVPTGRLDEVLSILERHGYDPVVVEDLAAFTVVKRKYSAHPDVIFSSAVAHRGVGRFNCFLLKDRESVEAAVEGGAIPFGETDLDVQF